jgi:hypothetical protein
MTDDLTIGELRRRPEELASVPAPLESLLDSEARVTANQISVR